MFSYFEPSFIEKVFWEIGFSNFGHDHFFKFSSLLMTTFAQHLWTEDRMCFCASLVMLMLYHHILSLISWNITATFVNCGHLKKNFTAPWLKNLVEYSYLLPKHSVKISWEKKWAFSFYITFCERGILHVSLWRVAL